MEKIITALLFCYFVFFPFGQLTRLPIKLPDFPEVQIYLTDFVLFLLVGSWGVWRFYRRKRKYQLPPLAKPIFLFSLVAVLSLIFNIPLLSNREVLVAALYLIRLLVYFGFYFVIYDLKTHFNWLKWPNLVNFLLAIGTAIAVFGLFQYLVWPDMSSFETLGWDPHYYRLVGTFFDPGFTGIILILALIFFIVSYWNKFTNLKFKNFPYYLLLITLYFALALTYSRSSYLAFLAGAAAIAWVKKAPKLFLAVFLILALTLVVLPRPGGEGVRLERTVSAQARVNSWQQALIIARDHPIFGIGFNAYRYAQKKYGFLDEKWQISHAGTGADSSLLFVLATTGALGLAVYLWFCFTVIKLSWRAKNSSQGLIVLASLLALLTHSFFLNSLFYPWVIGWMAIILVLL